MLPISRILFPVDFSERALEMLPYGREITAKYHAELTLLNVINPIIAVPDAGTYASNNFTCTRMASCTAERTIAGLRQGGTARPGRPPACARGIRRDRNRSAGESARVSDGYHAYAWLRAGSPISDRIH